jgi:peptide/nickel transport system substrate-binding protein
MIFERRGNMSPNRAYGPLIWVAFSLVFAACGGSSEPGQGEGASRPTITVVASVPFSGLDPQGPDATAFWSLAVNFGNVSEGLTRFNGKDATVRPGLATEWRWMDEEKTRLRLTLREGVKFHDGEDFNADVAAKNIERMLDPAVKSAIDFLGAIERVEPVDARTLDVITDAPYSRLPDNLSVVMMLSPAQLTSNEITGDIVGTGPYKIARRTSREIVLTRNAEYWGDLSDTAPQQVTLRPVEEAGARVAAVASGEADIVFDVPAELADEVPKVEVAPLLSMVTWRIDARAGITQDIRVRKAIVLGTDRELVRKSVVGETYSEPCSSNYAPPGVFGWNPSLEQPPPYDPATAKRLLAEAGALGKTITFVAAPRFAKSVEASEAFAQQLEELGLNVEYEVRDIPGWLKIIYNEGVSNIVIYGGDAEQWDAVTLIQKVLTGPPSRYPVSAIERLETLVMQAQSATDEAQRESLSHQLLADIDDQSVILCGWIPKSIYGARENVSWSVRRDNTIEFATVKKVN